MLWVLETDFGDQNVWWCEERGTYSSNFGDATVYASEKSALPPYPNATWVALDMEDWISE